MRSCARDAAGLRREGGSAPQPKIRRSREPVNVFYSVALEWCFNIVVKIGRIGGKKSAEPAGFLAEPTWLRNGI